MILIASQLAPAFWVGSQSTTNLCATNFSQCCRRSSRQCSSKSRMVGGRLRLLAFCSVWTLSSTVLSKINHLSCVWSPLWESRHSFQVTSLGISRAALFAALVCPALMETGEPPRWWWHLVVVTILVTSTLGKSRSALFYVAGIARNGVIKKLHASAHLPNQKSSRIPSGRVLTRGEWLISTICSLNELLKE